MGLNGGAGTPVITATAIGNPLSFVTDMVRPLKSLVIPFTPIQEGSGDPSPTNVRPISGWTGLNIVNTNGVTFNQETGEFDFSESQLGAGTPSATNYRQIVPGLVLTRDDSTEITVYGGSLKLNSDGTSVLTAKRGVLKWTSDRQPSKLSNAYPRTAAVWPASTYLWGGSGHICDRAIWIVNDYRTVGSFCRAGTSWTFCSPTQEIYDIVDDAEWLAAMKTWLDANPITICSKLGTYKTYTLSATETARALEYLNITQRSVIFTDPTTGDPLTVYGGLVTLNEDGSVDLVATHRYFVVDPSAAGLNADKDTMVWAQISLPSNYSASPSTRDLYSNIFTNRSYGVIYGASASVTGNRILVGLPAEYDTTALVRQFFTDNQTQFAYLLATPQTYHFDNVGQLVTFIGTNNIWTDTNGTNTATYLKHQS